MPVTYEYLKEWRKRNPDKVREQNKRYAERNREKLNIKNKKWRDANPDRSKEHRQRHVAKNPDIYRSRDLKRTYGITIEERDAMFKAQGSRCGICRRDEATSWHVDHCHTSLKVRGILCNRCNLGLGYFKDVPRLLRAATSYLFEHKKS